MAVASKRGLLNRLLGPYAVLRGKRELSLLFSGHVVSSFGDWLYNTALLVLVFDLTRSATALAVLTFVRLLPYALFLPVTGVLADRWNRKVLMIVADLGRGACMLGLLAVQSRSTVWIAFPLVFVTTTLSSLFRPASSSVLPQVAGDEEDLVRANSIWSQMDALSFVLGPSLGALLVYAGQIYAAFVINGLTFLFSAVTLFFLRVPARGEERPVEEGSWLSETLSGFRFLFRENEGVLAAFTLTIAGLSLLGGAFWTLLVVLAEESFRIGSAGSGYLNAAYGFGGVLGGFVVGRIISRLGIGRAFIWGAVASSLIVLPFGLSPAGFLPFALIALIGITDVFSEVTGNHVIQTGTPNEMLGRVFGAFESATVLAMLVGALGVGPLIDFFGPRAATIILAVAGLALWLVCLPRLRRLEEMMGVRIFLRGVPMLAGLPHRTLENVASRVQLQQAPEGATIVREGEQGDRLYILKSGEAEVIARGGGLQDVSVATLSKADYFGEISLLRDVPRTATVRTCGPVELYSLSRTDFQELLERSEELRASMTGASDARYIDTQNRLLLRR